MPTDRIPPILSIPPNILGDVFVLCKNSDADPGPNDVDLDSPVDPPTDAIQYACAAVCRSFRQVTLGTALLWNNVTVRPTSILDKVTAYCLRSGTATLNIRVDLLEGWDDDVEVVENVYRMLQVVASHSDRWQTLSVFLESEPADRPSVVGMLCERVAPALEHLTLAVDDFDELKHTNWVVNATSIVHSSPEIRFLRLRGLATSFFWPPLGRLVVFHLDQTFDIPIKNFETLKGLLTASQELRHLSLYGLTLIGGWPVAVTDEETIHLPSLTSLRLCGHDKAIFSGALSHISAPLLHSLTLRKMHEDDLRYDPDSEIPLWLPQVKHLSFCDFDFSEVAHRSIFRILPCIEVFDSISTTIGVSMCCRSLRSTTISPWPKLRTLRFGFNLSDDAQLILEVLAVRYHLGFPPVCFQFATLSEEAKVARWLAKAHITDDQAKTEVVPRIDIDKWPILARLPSYEDPDDTVFYAA